MFISMVILLNHFRLKSFKKIYDGQNTDVVLIGNKSESLFGIQKERLFAAVTVRPRHTKVNKKFFCEIS